MHFPWVMAAGQTAGELGGHFTWIDWTVVFGYLALTTLIGGWLAGRQTNIQDFFLGGRKLPWYAVSGSIIATEISAITFVGVPYLVFRPGGDFTYLQLGVFGALFARLIVAYVLVPAYYEKRIFSPYDYMGQRLGPHVRSMTTVLFSLSGLLAQSARVYLTALVLSLVLHDPLNNLETATGIPPLVSAVGIIGLVAMAWTLMGGIATVIWTDVILFLVFVIGALTSLGFIAYHLPGGFTEIFAAGTDAGKFRFFDFNPSPLEEFTIWTAVIAATWGNVGAYGTDQLMAQRIFCCRNTRDARLAVITSWAGMLVTLSVLLVGVGLYAYYQHYPLTGAALEAYEETGDNIFPIFILTVIPAGLTGLIIAGIFAAAISSLDSILAALSQTTLSAFYLPRRKRKLARMEQPLPVKGDLTTEPNASSVNLQRAEDRRTVLVSRMLVVFWTIVLCAIAVLVEEARQHYGALLSLALAMAGYVGGTLMAGFFLAFWSGRLNIDGRGYLWSAPLSVLAVFSMVWFNAPNTHEPLIWAYATAWIGGLLLLLTWIVAHLRHPTGPQRTFRRKTGILLAGIALVLWIKHFGYFDGGIDEETGRQIKQSIAWPWYAPVGSLVAFFFGWALAGPGSPAGRSAERQEKGNHGENISE